MAIRTGKVTVTDEWGNCKAEVEMNDTASVHQQVSLDATNLTGSAKLVFPAEAAITLGTALVTFGEAARASRDKAGASAIAEAIRQASIPRNERRGG